MYRNVSYAAIEQIKQNKSFGFLGEDLKTEPNSNIYNVQFPENIVEGQINPQQHLIIHPTFCQRVSASKSCKTWQRKS